MIKRKICSLVNSLVVMNQSLWANAKALIITIAIAKALTLVIRLPIEPFIRPPIIKNNPAPNSVSATKMQEKEKTQNILSKLLVVMEIYLIHEC